MTPTSRPETPEGFDASAPSPQPSDVRDDKATAGTRRTSGGRTPVRGVLLAAAAAPYRFDPAARRSFYVHVRTEAGERTLWGADLEMALTRSASQPRVGDQVVVLPLGTKPVRLRLPVRDAHGDVVGDERILAQRRHWRIETPEHLQMLAYEARRLRAEEAPSPASVRRDPRLMLAMAGLQLAAQYAAHATADRHSRQQLLVAIRERIADALAEGRDLRLPERRAQIARVAQRPDPHHAIDHGPLSHDRA